MTLADQMYRPYRVKMLLTSSQIQSLFNPHKFTSLAADKAGKYVPQQQRHANERRVSYSKDQVMRPALYYEQSEESLAGT
jgi:hypothetical protein